MILYVKSTDFDLSLFENRARVSISIAACSLSLNINSLQNIEFFLFHGLSVISQYWKRCRVFKLAYGAQLHRHSYLVAFLQRTSYHPIIFSLFYFCTCSLEFNFSKIYKYTDDLWVPQCYILFTIVFACE